MFEGLIAFPITPTDAEGRVDVVALRRLVRRLADAEVDAVCVLGSTGTYPFLSREERRRAVEAAALETGGRTPLMAGVGALRTDHAAQHARDARAAGAHAGLLAPMSYTPLTEEEVFTHFETVAADGGLTLCVYDNPGTTHFRLSDGLLARLAAIPGVAAVKSPAPALEEVAARHAALRAHVPAGFSVGFSTDWHAAEGLIAGGDAWYSVLAGLLPKPAMAIRRAIEGHDFVAARRLNAQLEPMWDLFRKFSSLRVTYAAAGLLGLTDAAPPRPILPLPPEARARVAAVLEELSAALG